MSPGVFLGRPDDVATIPPELYQSEVDGIHATYEGDAERGLMAGGECAQRIDSLPTVQEVVDRIMQETTEIVRNFPKHLADS